MNNKKAENSPSVKKIRSQESNQQKERPCTLPKESELNCRAVATLLKAVCCFLQLSLGLKLGNRYFVELLLNSPGLLDLISFSFESLERLDYPFDYLLIVVLVFDPNPVELRDLLTINGRL